MDVRQSLNALAAATWDEHTLDVTESHRWIEGFFDNLRAAGHARSKGAARPVMSELMKTPGRKRLADTNVNVLGSAKAAAAAKRDPVATLLFPSAPSAKGKENGGSSDENSMSMLSPVGKKSNGSGNGLASPMRSPMRVNSPRVGGPARSPGNVFGSARKVAPIAPLPPRLVEQPRAIIQPSVAQDETSTAASADLSNVMEVDDEGEGQATPSSPLEGEVEESNRFSTASTVPAEETANLSIIGEEAEEEEEQAVLAPTERAKSPLAQSAVVALEPSSSLVLPETQFSAPEPSQEASTSPTANINLDALGPTSPRNRVISGASSVAAEADADTAVPLNDEPSSLRNGVNPLSSSVPSSAGPANASTRTPGGTISRFATSSFSAAKLGVGLGSSPPPVHAASAGGNARASTGGARQLNFVGLPKKSLGLGLSIGRTWASGSASDSQGSQNSQPSAQAVTTGAVSTTSVSAPASTVVVSTKRKSLSQDEGPNKSSRVEPQDLEEAASKARRDALASRMKNMQARQSALPGSRTSGIMSTSINKPLSASAATAPHASEHVAAVTALTTATTTVTSVFSAQPSVPAPVALPEAAPTGATLTRRPSVMDRVKSFEKSSASDSRIPSPSKMPSAAAYAATHPISQIGRPQSPLLGSQPRSPVPTSARMMSPTIGSPSAPSRIAFASPGQHRMQLRSSPVVQAKSPARAANAQLLRTLQNQAASTTPKASPPAAHTGARSILQQLGQQASEQEQEDVAEMSIRQVTQPSASGPQAQELDETDDMSDHEHDARPSLPPQPEVHEADDGDMDGDDERDEAVVVEKGRGALVSAMEVNAIKPSESKTVMPGGFGAEADADEQDEEGDQSIEIVEAVPKTSGFKPTLHKKGSQSSLASSQSSQSAVGVLSSLFGKGGKSKDGKVKSIQLAAAAAKKEQQEKERKAAQKEEREQKRIELLQKRQDEERVKVDEERKARLDIADKKRKERDEIAAKNAKMLKNQKAKVDEEPAKKRKIEPEVKRSEVKKAQSFRPVNGSTFQSSSLNSSQNRNPLATSQGRSAMGPPSTSTTPANGGVKSSQNSMIGVKFMAAPGAGPSGSSAPRAANPGANKSAPNSQHRPAPPPPARVEPEPYQELPDIDSEYSDSGDEGHDEKIRALPQWAQSPALADALYRQQRVNPDDIFGPIPPLSMQEIFRTNSTRITKRTSSACWEGTDALTADDLARYNRAMGFTSTSTSTSTTTRMSSHGGGAR